MDDAELDRRVDEWAAGIQGSERADPVWSLRAYSTARYALALAKGDVVTVRALDRVLAGQLLRAVGSVAANIGEGYGRSSLTERARYLQYALGSIREAISWYDACDIVLGRQRAARRAAVLSRVRRLSFGLLRAAKKQSGRMFSRG